MLMNSHPCNRKDVTRNSLTAERAERFHFEKTAGKFLRAWFKIANDNHHQKRMEVLVMENQRHLFEMLRESEQVLLIIGNIVRRVL